MLGVFKSPWSCAAILSRAAMFSGLALFSSSGVLVADDAAPVTPVSYHKQIRPIFQTNCQGCHQPARRGGEFVMTSVESMLQKGESGSAGVVPGQPEQSYLLSQIKPVDGKAAMPKGKEDKPLKDVEIELITRWIAEGAKDDSPASSKPQYDNEHPPKYAAPPVITSIAYSPDGSLIAVSGYHEVLLHKADGSGLAGRLVGLSERIEKVAFSPDGTKLAVAGGSPGRFGEIQIWNVADRKLELAVPAGFDTAYGVSWAPNGKLLGFGCSDNTIRAIDPTTGQQVLFNGAHSDWVLDTAFSTNSDHMVTVSRDMSMKLVEVATQRFIDNITSITPGALKGGLATVEKHPTKDEFLVGGSDGEPKTYRMIRTTARQIGDDANLLSKFQGLPGRVFAVAYSRDGNKIAAASSSDGKGTVRAYAVEGAKVLFTAEIPEGGAYAVAFSPDGNTLAVAGFDGVLRFYKVADGTLEKTLPSVEVQAKVAAK